MSRLVPALKGIVLAVHVIGIAALLPLTVAANFPPPLEMQSPLFFFAWLAWTGGLAGYGLYKL